jgi:hypothetical protein
MRFLRVVAGIVGLAGVCATAIGLFAFLTFVSSPVLEVTVIPLGGALAATAWGALILFALGVVGPGSHDSLGHLQPGTSRL